MAALLRWAGSIVTGTLNAIAKVVVFIILVIVVVTIIGLWKGDGLPRNMVIALDLRHTVRDSAPESPFALGSQPLNVMDVVFALDEASRDARVKGVLMRVGAGGLASRPGPRALSLRAPAR